MCYYKGLRLQCIVPPCHHAKEPHRIFLPGTGRKTILDPYLPADMDYPATNGFPGKTIVETIHIQHQFNGGECRVTSMSLPVDGKSGNQIFQMHGCSVHGCDRCWANRNRDGTLKEFNWRGDKVEELKKQTLEITQKLKKTGTRLISIWDVNGKR